MIGKISPHRPAILGQEDPGLNLSPDQDIRIRGPKGQIRRVAHTNRIEGDAGGRRPMAQYMPERLATQVLIEQDPHRHASGFLDGFRRISLQQPADAEIGGRRLPVGLLTRQIRTVIRHVRANFGLMGLCEGQDVADALWGQLVEFGNGLRRISLLVAVQDVEQTDSPSRQEDFPMRPLRQEIRQGHGSPPAPPGIRCEAGSVHHQGGDHQSIAGRVCLLIDRVVAALDVDDDELAPMGRFDQLADVPLVDRLTARRPPLWCIRSAASHSDQHDC
jgi:hypothetical protein